MGHLLKSTPGYQKTLTSDKTGLHSLHLACIWLAGFFWPISQARGGGVIQMCTHALASHVPHNDLTCFLQMWIYGPPPKIHTLVSKDLYLWQDGLAWLAFGLQVFFWGGGFKCVHIHQKSNTHIISLRYQKTFTSSDKTGLHSLHLACIWLAGFFDQFHRQGGGRDLNVYTCTCLTCSSQWPHMLFANVSIWATS